VFAQARLVFRVSTIAPTTDLPLNPSRPLAGGMAPEIGRSHGYADGHANGRAVRAAAGPAGARR